MKKEISSRVSHICLKVYNKFVKFNLGIVTVFIVAIIAAGFISKNKTNTSFESPNIITKTNTNSNPLSIQSMKSKSYPGSQFVVEQNLGIVSNYHKYIVSYISDGLKIYALLTVPTGQKPSGGWPVIIFNHGYLAPQTYQTNPSVGQYASYYPKISEAGFIVLKPDYRGNGNSQGQPEGAYYSPAYATDVLNAVSSIKQYKDANPNKIGMWGHSMGGNITLRNLVVDSKDIKVAVIWGGVVGSYIQLQNWHDPSYHPSAYELSLRYRYRADLVQKYGTPQSNPTFWNQLDPTAFISDIKAPIQLHFGTADEEVPPDFSTSLFDKLKSAGKTAEIYSYPGDNHNISGNFNTAMQRSIDFFNKYLK